MEHVNDVLLTSNNIGVSLKEGAIYRFTCPNYLFPYEPHFNIPIVITKRLTEKIFRNKIHQNRNIIDPEGTWNSLNWINVIRLIAVVKGSSDLSIKFSSHLLFTTLERVL